MREKAHKRSSAAGCARARKSVAATACVIERERDQALAFQCGGSSQANQLRVALDFFVFAQRIFKTKSSGATQACLLCFIFDL